MVQRAVPLPFLMFLLFLPIARTPGVFSKPKLSFTQGQQCDSRALADGTLVVQRHRHISVLLSHSCLLKKQGARLGLFFAQPLGL